MAKTTENNVNTKKRILDVATELFANKGFEGTSTREICQTAGVNISLISYYFGGKQELYHKIIESITSSIIVHMSSLSIIVDDFDNLSKDKKIELFLQAIEKMIDFFYSDAMSNSKILLLVKEQMTSSVTLNSIGYKMFKRLLASILEKDENDKEVIFRSLTIIGQINSARILTQFSLKFLNQEKYTAQDIQMIKDISISQTRSILEGVG